MLGLTKAAGSGGTAGVAGATVLELARDLLRLPKSELKNEVATAAGCCCFCADGNAGAGAGAEAAGAGCGPRARGGRGGG